MCVGENLEENESGKTLEIIDRQITAAFYDLDTAKVSNCVIAYEPIWAIGTGKPATGEGANEVIGAIRQKILELHGEDVAYAVRIQYGGSVNEGNIAEFVSQPQIDGALVGGASLHAEQFVRMVAITNQIKR